MSRRNHKPNDEVVCITYERCLPPARSQAITGKWWRYSLRTRSGLNQVTGYRLGTEAEVTRWLTTTQRAMELREKPFGEKWRAKVLRPQQSDELAA